jgi:hypothetical protein
MPRGKREKGGWYYNIHSMSRCCLIKIVPRSILDAMHGIKAKAKPQLWCSTARLTHALITYNLLIHIHILPPSPF